jgi:hypothetical protein
MFAGKAGAYPSEALFSCSTLGYIFASKAVVYLSGTPFGPTLNGGLLAFLSKIILH